MSMEESDVIVKLKPQIDWVSATSKDELADKIKEAIEKKIPNMEIEFTQPIEMRFNELISGTRSDIAIKLFGEDLDILAQKAIEIENAIQNIKGASDIIVEKTEGLPQMSVRYNRSKIARYGLNISDLNNFIALGFAGKAAGQVFEGEKRFDLVVRLNENKRASIDDLRNLFVSLSNGEQIPLHELATIEYSKGPAKISRDDTKRRVVVGVNVRNRDLQSVVEDIKYNISSQVVLPEGYSIEYGGQFKNLESAKGRLSIAVPIALVLIFILLYFAFGSIKEAIMVYSAIPLSAVGGILFLWIRDLPFSISAGVGFIALFGIAVLNGIVLIEHFKELKQHQDDMTLDDLIIKGTTDRLRPVLLTASAAALGFLPMAISSSAGAEVQRPLATVVIGGLITATLLTMIVLPVLFKLLDKKDSNLLKFKKIKSTTLILVFLFFGITTQSQEKKDELSNLIQLANQNNKEIKALELKLEKAKVNATTAFTLDKTTVYYSYDQNNLAVNNQPLKVFGVQQNFDFPSLYFAKKKQLQSDYEVESKTLEIEKNKLNRKVSQNYYEIVYWQNREKLYQYLDSLYQSFSKASNRRFELGETNYLEKITAQAKSQKIAAELVKIEKERTASYHSLQALLQTDSLVVVNEDELNYASIKNSSNTVYNSYYESVVNNYDYLLKLQKQAWFPSVSAEYFQGKNTGLSSALYGFQIGLNVPVFFSGNAKKTKMLQLEKESWNQQKEAELTKINQFVAQKKNHLIGIKTTIDYYETSGKKLSDEILKVANMSYKHGEIDFFQYIQSLENALQIKIDYLDAILEYNNTILDIEFINYQ